MTVFTSTEGSSSRQLRSAEGTRPLSRIASVDMDRIAESSRTVHLVNYQKPPHVAESHFPMVPSVAHFLGFLIPVSTLS